MNNILSCITLLLTVALASHAAELPNILWVTSEDNGPHLGCYGDDYATTPNLDALAKKGMIYTRALSNAPVCAPARTTIISGMYPPSTGSEHMRTTNCHPITRCIPRTCVSSATTARTTPKKITTSARKVRYGMKVEERALEKPPRQESTVLRYLQLHDQSRKPNPQTPSHASPRSVQSACPRLSPRSSGGAKDWAQYHDKITEMDAKSGRSSRN